MQGDCCDLRQNGRKFRVKRAENFTDCQLRVILTFKKYGDDWLSAGIVVTLQSIK